MHADCGRGGGKMTESGAMNSAAVSSRAILVPINNIAENPGNHGLPRPAIADKPDNQGSTVESVPHPKPCR